MWNTSGSIIGGTRMPEDQELKITIGASLAAYNETSCMEDSYLQCGNRNPETQDRWGRCDEQLRAQLRPQQEALSESLTTELQRLQTK